MQLNVQNLLLFHESLLYLPRTVVVQLLSHVSLQPNRFLLSIGSQRVVTPRTVLISLFIF